MGELFVPLYSSWHISLRREQIRRHDYIHWCSASFSWDMIHLWSNFEPKSQRLHWAPLGRLQVFVSLKHTMVFVESETDRHENWCWRSEVLTGRTPTSFISSYTWTPPSASVAPLSLLSPQFHSWPLGECSPCYKGCIILFFPPYKKMLEKLWSQAAISSPHTYPMFIPELLLLQSHIQGVSPN